jgi:CIC family chloride channel protein
VLRGLVSSDSLRLIASRRGQEATAAEIMQPAMVLGEAMSLRAAADLMLGSGLRELPVVDPNGRIVGFLDEADISRAYLLATAPMRPGSTSGTYPIT